ncbi:hypothetical protein AMTR_s00058p00190530 [Amborella trichopoda]|uniref:Uncharacterized protein n=1 Tax=Amborella trichopoda TaxID=13333 RepID=W1P9V5_AMBTC|nr:hypothetical protein AMTR_s00058p00190530 [Amborella trichopoda]
MEKNGLPCKHKKKSTEKPPSNFASKVSEKDVSSSGHRDEVNNRYKCSREHQRRLLFIEEVENGNRVATKEDGAMGTVVAKEASVEQLSHGGGGGGDQRVEAPFEGKENTEVSIHEHSSVENMHNLMDESINGEGPCWFPSEITNLRSPSLDDCINGYTWMNPNDLC